MSVGYVPNPASLPINYVKIVSSEADDDFQTGRTKPPRFTTEEPQSIVLVIDGKTRTSAMDPFDFRVSINNILYRGRMARVTKVVLPKPPNVTKFNNTLTWSQWDGVITSTHTVTLSPAFYNTTTLANEISSQMTTEAGGVNVYVVSFDPITRTFIITYTSAGSPRLFFIHSECSFIVRGEFLAHFRSAPGNLLPVDVGELEARSATAGMLYTRYAVISSESFNQYSYSDSRATTLRLRNNIICVADMTSVYEPEDYDVGTPYSGVFATVRTPDAPHIMITNPQKSLTERIDIFVQDEYGESFNEIMDLGSDFPPNTLGISLWMEIAF